MDQVIVTLDGKDHKIGYGEHTMCMLPVPHGTTREDGAKECKVCFATEDKDEPEAEPFAINTTEPEPAPAPEADIDATHGDDFETPEEGAAKVTTKKASSKKATKAK